MLRVGQSNHSTHKIETLADRSINTTTMKFSLFVIAALAAPATASQKRKAQKKGGSPSGSAHGATGPTTDDNDLIPIGGSCPADGRVKNTNLNNNCAIPPGLAHGVCLGTYTHDRTYIYCQTGQPGAYCEDTSEFGSSRLSHARKLVLPLLSIWNIRFRLRSDRRLRHPNGIESCGLPQQ